MEIGHFNSNKKAEKAVLIGVVTQEQSESMTKEFIDELEFLALTAGATTKRKFLQKLDKPQNKTYIGKGKLEEVKAYIDANSIDIAIFDDELSPSQIRNIEKVLDIKVIDRNNLILDIFAARAQTGHAKTQVELAQYQYLLPRLTKMWTHLDRQKGGIGMRGTGETQIEADRRIIQDKIAKLKEKLKKIDKQMSVQRGNRGELVRVSLVGYTNVGKSTIMNLLSKSDVFAENKLFATLDTTVRKVVIDNLPFLLSDTVGFIRKLPHQLVESFKSTLDEVRESDILIHVLDISHPFFEDQFNVVNETLAEIDKNEKKTFVVFNKIDAYNPSPESVGYHPDGKVFALEELKKTWMAKLNDQCIFISAQDKTNIDEFKAIIYKEVRAVFEVRYPYHHFLY
jgi:GTP-binding protein HflX